MVEENMKMMRPSPELEEGVTRVEKHCGIHDRVFLLSPALRAHGRQQTRLVHNEHIHVYYTLLLHSASSPAESYYNLVTR